MSTDQSTRQDRGRLHDFAEWRRAQRFDVQPPGPRPADTAPFEERRAWAEAHCRSRMAQAQTPDAFDNARHDWLTIILMEEPNSP